ncbi:MAG: orotate phosphoribosyltransferase [Bacteroidales bacterium]|nr:orotate phosphoribosyltransferase [Bacteroidales bacterium]
MKTNLESARLIAQYLLQVKAIKLSPKKPFTWASGWKSPIYCDNRVTLSYPKIRTGIRQEFVKTFAETFGSADVIVGVATGGVPQGTLVAQDLGLPFAYVRAAEKKHGLGNLIEGVVEPGQTAVVIEDLISTGGSSLKAVEALREAGVVVKGMMAIFTYGFQVAEDQFKEAKVPLVTLSDYETLVQLAAEENYITAGDIDSLSQWRKNPGEWGKQFDV